MRLNQDSNMKKLSKEFSTSKLTKQQLFEEFIFCCSLFATLIIILNIELGMIFVFVPLITGISYRKVHHLSEKTENIKKCGINMASIN